MNTTLPGPWALPLAFSLLRASYLNFRDVGAIFAILAAVAWPDLCLHYLRTGRRKLLRKWWKQIDWRAIGTGFASIAAFAGAIAGIGALSNFLWPPPKTAPRTASTSFHLHGIPVDVLIGIGITAAVIILLLAARHAVGVYGESRTSATALKEIANRVDFFEADEIVMTLQSLGSRHALKAFLWTLRARPMLCTLDALNVLSDLACAAREKSSQTSVPRGSSSQYATWARNRDRASLQRVLRWLDQGAIDDIVLLTEQVRAMEVT